MMRRDAFVPLLLACALVLLAGCTAELPDARFGCTQTSECPSGFTCDGTVCRRGTTGTDAGTPLDGETGTDAFTPGDDAFTPADDAAVCTDCVTITLTNAFGPSMEGKAYMLEDQALTSPPYGETYGPYVVSLADGALDVSGDLGAFTWSSVAAEGSYVLAITWDAGTSSPTLTFLPAPLGTPLAGHTTIRPVDALFDADTHAMDDGIGGAALLGRSSGMHDYDLTDATPESIMLVRFDLGTAGTALAALDTGPLPTGAVYYVFVAGRADAHLGAADGIRFIPAVPGASAQPSLPLAWGLNTTTTKVEICDGPRLLLTLAPNAIVGAIPGARVSHNLQVRDGSTTTGCTSSTLRTFTWPDLIGTPSARVLIAVIGVVAPGSTARWGAGGGYEGPPGTMSGGEVVTYANGVPMTTLDFGIPGMPAIVSVPMLDSRSYEWPSPPTELLVTYASTNVRHFDWTVTTPAAAVIALTDGTNYAAYEISMPFGGDWSYDVQPGTPYP